MKRFNILAATAVAVVSAFLFTGCAGITIQGSGSSDLPDVNLSDTASVQSLCGADAEKVLDAVSTAANAKKDSGQRNALTKLGLTSEAANDDATLTQVIGALKVRASIENCENKQTSTEDGRVGIEDHDGGQFNLPLVSGGNTTLVIDTTTQTATAPLLDGSLTFTAQTLTWEGLVQRVGDQQWYKDGINARAAQTGFTWDDVLKFASVNRMKDGKVDQSGKNALAIQVFGRPDLTEGQVRDQIRTSYFSKPSALKDFESTIGMSLDELPIQRIDNGFINTRNVNKGTDKTPEMGNFFDTQSAIRLSLMPFKFDDQGKPVSLDGSRGAGIFIDCGNLHWVPKAVWHCTTDSCEKPQCPAGTIGTPPNCQVPPTPEVCPYNPALPPDSPDCHNDRKIWAQSPHESGWVELWTGELTDGRQSQHQQESGETSGNVIDNKVSEGTKSNDVTPDLPNGTVEAPGATTGGDDQSKGNVDNENTNKDDGGTKGDTCVPDPIAGITC